MRPAFLWMLLVGLPFSMACAMQAEESVPQTIEQQIRAETRAAYHPPGGLPAPDDPNRTFAAYDRRCNAMKTSVATVDPIDELADADYFDAPIPRQVHQIWFGNRAALDDTKPAMWREMASRFDYGYRLWTEDDIDELRAMMPQQNADWLAQFLHNGSYHSASDIARVSILEQLGGLYIDCDMRPPSKDGVLVDPARVFPMRNIVLMSEVHARDAGARISLFVANGFALASAHHPVIRHLVDSMPTNVDAMVRHGAADKEGRGPAEFMTGPFVWTRSLAGAVTVMPFTYLKKWNVL